MKKLIYFTADWCSPCRTFGPIMDRVAQSGIPVEKVNVDKAPAVVNTFNVGSVPTVVLINANGNELGRFTGVRSENEVKQLYNQN